MVLMIQEGKGKGAVPRMVRNADGSLRLNMRGRDAPSLSSSGSRIGQKRPSFLYRFFRIGGDGANPVAPDIGDIWKQQETLRSQRELEEAQKDAELRARWVARAKTLRQRIPSSAPDGRLHITLPMPHVPSFVSRLRPKHYLISGAFLLLLLVGGIGLGYSRNESKDQPSVAGATYGGESAELPQEKPQIPLLFPNEDANQYRSVLRRVSPDGTPPVYVYVDTVGGVRVLVSQQEVPDAFKEDQSGKLKQMATDFQATSVVVVDGQSIYHGVSERDGVQSIIFIKDKNLFFVKADARLTDAQVSAYYLSLQ